MATLKRYCTRNKRFYSICIVQRGRAAARNRRRIYDIFRLAFSSQHDARKDSNTRTEFNLQIFPDGKDRINLHNRLSELRHLAAEFRNEKKGIKADSRCSPFTCDFDGRDGCEWAVGPKVKVNLYSARLWFVCTVHGSSRHFIAVPAIIDASISHRHVPVHSDIKPRQFDRLTPRTRSVKLGAAQFSS